LLAGEFRDGRCFGHGARRELDHHAPALHAQAAAHMVGDSRHSAKRL
jgi:hypothetical protein